MGTDSMLGDDGDLRSLPGAALVLDGIRDIMDERMTAGACLVAIALPKLQAAGLLPEGFQHAIPHGELALYRIMRQEKGNAYARYGALIRELVSFEHALAFHQRKKQWRFTRFNDRVTPIS